MKTENGSASKVSPRQLGELIAVVSRLLAKIVEKFSASQIQRIIENPKNLEELFLDAFAKKGESDIGTFRVQVNYDLRLEAAIKSGNYDWKNDDINDKNFPSKRSGSAELDIRLVHFNKDMSYEDILKELDKMSLRPAELPELLALGAKYPDEQRKYPIVAMGSMWRGYGGRDGEIWRIVPSLWNNRGRRGLSLDCHSTGSECGWSVDFRFAAVSKEKTL